MQRTLIETHYQSISLEAGLLDSLKVVPSGVRKLATSVSQFVIERLDYLITPKVGVKIDPSIARRFGMKLDYAAAQPLEVYVPPGLNIPMADFIHILEDDANIIARLKEGVLTPVLRWLSILISNPEKLNDVKDYKREVGLILKGSSLYQNLLDQRKVHEIAFKGNPSLDKQSYGRAYPSHGAFKNAIDEFNKVYEITVGVTKAEITELVENISSAADLLTDRIENNVEGYVINTRNAKDLSDALYQTANLVEFYAHHCHLVNVTYIALKDTADKFENILGRK